MTTGTPSQATEDVGLVRSELELSIGAPIETVWKAMTSDVASWWDEGFYFTGKPHTIQLDARIGGRLYETGAGGDALSWGEVVAIQPGRSITFGGPFAPPYAGPAYATLHLALEARGDVTVFRLSQSVFGHIHEGMSSSLQQGWNTLFGGLKAHVEKAR
jgi:uncharacterized protein YndB with AHSA1/START domain